MPFVHLGKRNWQATERAWRIYQEMKVKKDIGYWAETSLSHTFPQAWKDVRDEVSAFSKYELRCVCLDYLKLNDKR